MRRAIVLCLLTAAVVLGWSAASVALSIQDPGRFPAPPIDPEASDEIEPEARARVVVDVGRGTPEQVLYKTVDTHIGSPGSNPFSTSSDTWKQVPKMNTRVKLEERSTIVVEVCAVMWTPRGVTGWVRVTVDADEVPPGSIPFASNGNPQAEPRCFTFAIPGIEPGRSRVVVQYGRSPDTPGTVWMHSMSKRIEVIHE